MAAKKTRKKTTSKKKAAKRTTRKPAKSARKKSTAKKPAAKKKARKSARRKATGNDGRVAEIQRLIDVMVDAGAVEVELEEAGTKLRVRLKDDTAAATMVGYAAAPAAMPAAPAAVPAAPAASESAPAAADQDVPGRTVFNSPMVGTFYGSPSPDADAFVKPGDTVSADSTLCILEAMKVMNEIKAEMDGTIVEVLAQNGQPVEFGQPLFVIQA